MNKCYKCKVNEAVAQIHLAGGRVEEACTPCRSAFHDGRDRGREAEYYRILAALHAAGMSEAKAFEIIGRI